MAFDHAQSPRLGQKTPIETPNVLLCTSTTMPEVARRGMPVYVMDLGIFRVYDGTAWRDVGGGTGTGGRTHVGPTEPVADDIGEMWLNTTNNLLYVWDGTEWVLATPPADGYLVAAAKAIYGVLKTDEQAYVIYYGTSAPGSPSSSTLWLNETTNIANRWNGATWVSYGSLALNTALNSYTDLETIDGEVEYHYTGVTPTLGATDRGDIWVNEDTNVSMVWSGAYWLSLTLSEDDFPDGPVVPGGSIITGTLPKLAIDPAFAAELLGMTTDINTAMTTANGKNKVYHSTGTPGVTANTAGDTWFQYNGSDQIIAQWRGTGGTSWVSETLANAVIATLDAGKITTGTLDAERIGAHSLRADKLMVGGNNLLSDPTFEITTLGYDNAWGPNDESWSVGIYGGASSSNALQTVNDATTRTISNFPGFASEEGARYRILAEVQNVGAVIPVGCIEFTLNYVLSDGSVVQDMIPNPELLTGDTWHTMGMLSETPAPTGTVGSFFTVSVLPTLPTGTLKFNYISIVRALTGELVVDGSIKAESIDSMYARTIELEATRIKTGELTADISVTSGSFRVTSEADPNKFASVQDRTGLRLYKADGVSLRVSLPTGENDTAYISGNSEFDDASVKRLTITDEARVGIGAAISLSTGLTAPPAPTTSATHVAEATWSEVPGSIQSFVRSHSAGYTVIGLYYPHSGGISPWAKYAVRIVDTATGTTLDEVTYTSSGPYLAQGYGRDEYLLNITPVPGTSDWRMWFASGHNNSGQVTIYRRTLTWNGPSIPVSAHDWVFTPNLSYVPAAKLYEIGVMDDNNSATRCWLAVRDVTSNDKGVRFWELNKSTGARVGGTGAKTADSIVSIPAEAATLDTTMTSCTRTQIPENDGSGSTTSSYYRVVVIGNRAYVWADTTDSIQMSRAWDTPPGAALSFGEYNTGTNAWNRTGDVRSLVYDGTVYKSTRLSYNVWGANLAHVRIAYRNSSSERMSLTTMAKGSIDRMKGLTISLPPLPVGSGANHPDGYAVWVAMGTEPALGDSAWKYLGHYSTSTAQMSAPSATTTPATPSVSTFLDSTPSRIVSTKYRAAAPDVPNFEVLGDGTGRWDYLIPVGTLLWWTGRTDLFAPPPGWLVADGATQLVVSYPDLAALYWNGTAYQYNFGGEGAGMFRLPHLMNRFVRGSGVSGWFAGADNATLTADNIPQHNHTMNHDHSNTTKTVRYATNTSDSGSAVRVADIGGVTGATPSGNGTLTINTPSYSGSTGNYGKNPPDSFSILPSYYTSVPIIKH